MIKEQLSWSFLDLLTCGMGGMLMLFLVLLALQPSMSDGEVSGASDEGALVDSAFVVVVELLDGESLWDGTNAENPWATAGEEKWTSDRSEIGTNYAVFFRKVAPAANAKLKLSGVSRDSRGLVRIFAGGKSAIQYEFTGEDVASGELNLWPLPEKKS